MGDIEDRYDELLSKEEDSQLCFSRCWLNSGIFLIGCCSLVLLLLHNSKLAFNNAETDGISLVGEPWSFGTFEVEAQPETLTVNGERITPDQVKSKYSGEDFIFEYAGYRVNVTKGDSAEVPLGPKDGWSNRETRQTIPIVEGKIHIYLSTLALQWGEWGEKCLFWPQPERPRH
eukprot:gnl/MRDRNA2_/MRDRNA2_61669_c0_seq2.p1 gnl/MRDRNA2_/MRDRNA2_61669_c0~~gnl/MRDRNA2_/MRDRNA2_61669_c0_seq2.p1  ORF type:complete len:174 (+),score=21.19 gnl/MRDRNA2_/MRDRNA2_61669_c0_seq2:83-604(+)